ncbi:dihydroorotase [Aestuariispira insulae]|uniref:Dihydroorotase n=1 Tax=Aestuariispira insulae TaxID=1461337 RepID=A0A3D9HSE0_9PROT|nr:dihydroorotase [Aestuariispira insulae]RED52251.1 dihydroorotase [Aestuariispira insulae]
MDRLTITRPDDWHLHVRDGAMLESVVPYTARQFGRAIIMPNLTPPVTSKAMAASYRERIMAAVPAGCDFTPLMTAYMTDGTDPDDLAAGHAEGIYTAVKLYPANATTNSAFGVTDVGRLDPVLSRMAEIGMPLLIHGEVTHGDVDIFDREAVFIDTILKPMIGRHPDLKVVLEHITTEQAVEFVKSAGDNVAATITQHHMMINRSDIFKGGIRPHLYCLPIAKREQHRLAVREAGVSGHKRFFLGTDSAPHPVHAKESACGCAGIFNAPTAIEAYAQVFDEEGKLDNLEAFASLNGPAFYGLAPNQSKITLERGETAIPETLELAGGTIIPFMAGQSLNWRLAD